jgi:hypothetical protein
MFFSKALLIISMMIFMATAGNIIPDAQNSLQMNMPTNSVTGQSLTLRFSFPTGSAGLNYKQYIGVVFPVSLATSDLNFSNNPANFGCALSDGTTNTYAVSAAYSTTSPTQSLAAENNIAYCRLDEMTNVPLKAGVTYTLTLTLSIKVSTTQYVRQIGLFTSTANNAERVIIDSCPVFGTLGQYSDWEAYPTKPLLITNLDAPAVTTGPSSTNGAPTIYPYNSFDLTFLIKSTTFISVNDVYIVLRYPNNLVSGPQSISSVAQLDDSPLKAALKGTLALSAFAADSILISGLGEDLIPEREFRVVLRGWKALDNYTNNANTIDRALKLYVYYKNTYSVFSVSTNTNLQISQANILFSYIAHPEGWDIWRNGAWPMRFVFKPNTDLINGGYVIIQHVNAKDLTNKLSFIASTCDFSENDSSFDNTFGKRPNCFPLSLNHDFANKSTSTDYAGSGFFFYVKNLLSSKNYYVTVWLFADNCGGNLQTNFNVVGNTSGASVTFNFQVTLYKTITAANVNESRFSSTTNVVLAQSASTGMTTGKCYNALVGGAGFSAATLAVDTTSPMEFNTAILTSASFLGLAQKPPSTLTSAVDVALFKEIYDWAIASQTTATTATGYAADVTTGTWTEAFLYGSSSTITSGSYFLVKGTIPASAANPASGTNVAQFFAFPMTYIGGVANFYYAKSIFLFTSAWFSQGDLTNSSTGCYVSWTFHNNVVAPAVSSPNANAPVTVPFTTTGSANKPWKKVVFDASKFPNVVTEKFLGVPGAPTIYSEFQPNFITSVWATSTNMVIAPANTSAAVTLDVNGSSLGTSGPYKIVSAQMGVYNQPTAPAIAAKAYIPAITNTITTTWVPIDIINIKTAITTAGTIIYPVLFTSCLKWKTTLPTIKSIYSYIDIQWNYSYGGVTNRVNRFIKLYPEGGVFHDYTSKFVTASLGTTNPLYIHYAYANSSTTGVCLIELDAGVLNTLGDTNANTLTLWIFGGSLIETDYSDASATYPAAPLVNNISTYGLSSAPAVSKENLYYQDVTYVQHSYIFGSATTPTHGIFDQYVNLVGTPAPQTITTKTFYHLFMGSVLLLTGVSNSNITATDTTSRPPLLFPFYCPVAKDTTNIKNSYWSEKLPVVIGAWMSISSHNSINNLNKYIGYSQKNTVTVANAAQVNRMILNRTSKYASDYLAGAAPIITIKQNDGITIPSGTRLVNVTLRFNQYTKTATGNDNVLYLFNSTLNSTTNAAQHCSGHVLLVNKAITIDSSVILNFNNITNIKTGTFGYGNSPKTFYALGKPFHRAVLSGTNATYTYQLTAGVGATSETTNFLQFSNTSGVTNYYWTGIKRPTVDTFTTFNTNDYLAYFCTSIAVDLNTMATNFVRASNVFILDYNVDTAASWGSPSLGFDKGEQVIKGDIASNIKLVLAPPVNIPTGAQLTFGANTNAFTANTICGIVLTSGAVVRECTNSNQIITCTTNGGTSFNICCYNVAISDPFSLGSLTAVFPIYATTSLSNYVSTTIYNASTQIGGATNPFSFITNANSDSNPNYGGTTFLATVLNVNYSQVFQEGGYGKATITVSLPREPVRDGKIIFSGDFGNMLITGNIPRCVASFTSKFGASWDSADALVDTCSTYSFSNSSNPIVITTKKMVYKCGLSFTKTLTVQLWPVVVVNWAASTSNAFKVSLQLNSGDNIANNTSVFNMPTILGLDPKPTALGQADTLCAVSSINPRIPGTYGDYVFDFDLDTNKAALANQAPNEVTIFWPYAYYGSSQNVMCYYNQNLTNCSFTDEGILNIRFTQTLPVGSGKKVQVTVNSVLNPSVDGDYSFPCTVNSTNFSTQKRLNLITGSGKLSGGITLTTVIATGALRLMHASAKISDVNPRNTSTHIFRVTIDRGTDLTSSPLTIANSPYIMITFPKEYHLAWYPSVKPTASIDPYTNDGNNNIVKGNTIAPSNVIQSGNRVFIYLPDNSYTLDNTWRYWEIKVTNIVGPTDNTAQKVSQSTSAYDVIITNSNLTSLYRTHTNLNQGSFDPLVPVVDSWLAYNRGNTFTFDNTTWVIDIATGGVLNMLNIKPGRYYTSSFLVKANSSSTIQPSAVVMSLTDATFKTLDATYTVSSSHMQSIPFQIGVACGTAPGNYIVYFSYTLTTTTPASPANWAPLSPVQITIDNDTKGTISYQTPSSIPAAGSTWIGIVLSEPNFDALTVTWADADNVKNDPSAKLEGAAIPANTITTGSSTSVLSPIRCAFSITYYDINTPQIYKTSDPNTCYTWSTNTITININGATAIIPQDYNIVPAFTFYNAANDATLTNKNSIRFNIKFPYAPIYIYCSLVCINNDFPSDDAIKTLTVKNTNTLQFYSGVYTSTAGQDLIFTGLIRGQRYKLKCIIESVQGDKTKRTSTSGTLTQYTNANGTSIDIMPAFPQTTYCAQFLFNSDPGQETKIAIIQYCQKLFSSPGWMNNGCVVCTDSGISYRTPGLTLPDENICVAPKTTTLRFLDTAAADTTAAYDATAVTTTGTTTTGTTTTSTTPTSTTAGDLVIPVTVTENKTVLYSVCAVASPSCTSDVSGNKLYTDYFNQLKTDLATQDLFKKTLSILNAQVAQVNTYDDTMTPDLAALNISNPSIQLTGLVTFTATYANPLKCSYQISTAAASAAPLFDSIVSCTDALCGTVKPNSFGNTVSTNVNNLKALTPSTTYNIFFACTNDIPYAQKRATVIAAGSFTTQASSDNNPQNNCTANPNATGCTPISAGFFQYSFAAMFMLFALLF